MLFVLKDAFSVLMIVFFEIRAIGGESYDFERFRKSHEQGFARRGQSIRIHTDRLQKPLNYLGEINYHHGSVPLNPSAFLVHHYRSGESKSL